MIKILRVIPIIILLAAVVVFTGLTEFNKENKSTATFNGSLKIGTQIINNEKHINFKPVSLFGSTASRNNANSFASKSVSLVLDRSALRSLLSSDEKSISFSIPTGDALPLQLELIEQKVFSDDISFYEMNGRNKNRVEVITGKSYSGIIKGKERSIASISIFNDFVIGVICDETGNYVLGSVKENNNYTDNYIFYNDNDLLVLNKFRCGVEDNEDKYSRHTAYNNRGENPAPVVNGERAPARIYFEVDYRMFLDNNSNSTTLINYIQGMFAAVQLIYRDEQIPIQISQVNWWTSTDPYAGMSNMQTILTTFGNNTRDDFSGSLAQLLTTRNVGGGIAWIGVLCQPFASDGSGRFSFCAIENDYNNYPTYSWTVNVVAHELGHNFGSYHTQSCHWPINSFAIGALDSCVEAEDGFCFSSTRPNNNGTIMSYCHLNGQIRFVLGFGSMPGDTIRAWYARAQCMNAIVNSSEQPVIFGLKQNFPNPFNPSTTIRFLVPENAMVSLKVYDISGKEVAVLVNNTNYITGFYDINFNTSIYNLPSGPYFYKMTAVPVNGGNTFTQVKKMVLIK